ncbi:hypothetical protein ACHBTE_31150 [Streptomyces sp. M41]
MTHQEDAGSPLLDEQLCFALYAARRVALTGRGRSCGSVRGASRVPDHTP